MPDWTQTGKIPRLGWYDIQAEDFDRILVQTENPDRAIKLHLQEIRGIPQK